MKAQVNVHYTDRLGRDTIMMEYPVIEVHERFVCLEIAGMNVDFTKREVTLIPNEKDIEIGYKDRLNGFYDKWYRYNRVDEGAAYDEGCKMAVDSGKCPNHFTLIPFNR